MKAAGLALLLSWGFCIGSSVNCKLIEATILQLSRRLPHSIFFESLCHQLSNFLSTQGDKRAVLALVELGTKIQRVYSWIIAVYDKEMLRFSEQFALCYKRSFLRRERDSEPIALMADDRGRLQQNKPISRIGVV
jgi:hypothetical protein